MRLLLIAVALVAGCSAGTVPDQQPFVAVVMQYESMAAGPTPAPAPGVCETCGGKGVVGDGRVEVPCPQCRPKQETKSCLSGTCQPATRVIVR